MSTASHGGRRLATGLVFALGAAASFGLSGPFVKPLLDAGWSPGAATLVRTGGAAVVFAIPGAFALRGRWGVLLTNWRTILAFGIFGVLAAQVCYYSAIEHVSVGVALLVEYLAPVFLVLFAWARTRRHPGWFTIAGAIVALAGLVLVLNLAGSEAPSIVGIGWALIASLGACIYYVIAARQNDELPPIALAAAGMVVATITLILLGLVGVFDMRATFGSVHLLGASISWVVPALVIMALSTVAAYLFGLAGSVRLGTRIASFVGLTEVLFAVMFAWLLLGQLPAPIQFLGGALVIAGLVLVQYQRDAPAIVEPTLLGSTPTPATSDAPTPHHARA
ncbi:MAG TPA: DMT family transporter [Galbitalea sp.]